MEEEGRRCDNVELWRGRLTLDVEHEKPRSVGGSALQGQERNVISTYGCFD